MDSVYNQLTGSQYIYNGTTDSWFQSLMDWLSSTSNSTVLSMVNSTSQWPC